jgi:phage baseplate assembly protein W
VSTVPHFSLPFRIEGGTVATSEQDTLEEIADCVEAVLRTTVGARLELPEFGIPDQSFSLNGADPHAIDAAVQKWEPRAVTAAQANNESLDDFISQITLNVAGGA